MFGRLVDGRHLSDDLGDGNYCLVSTDVSEKLGLKVGDTVSFPLYSEENSTEIRIQKWEIVGIVEQYASVILPADALIESYGTETIVNLTLHDLSFILNSANAAESFIERAIPMFRGKMYALQADDHKFKRELYPVEMMMNLSTTLFYAAMLTGGILITMIISKSAVARTKDIAVMRSLSCKSGISALRCTRKRQRSCSWKFCSVCFSALSQARFTIKPPTARIGRNR